MTVSILTRLGYGEQSWGTNRVYNKTLWDDTTRIPMSGVIQVKGIDSHTQSRSKGERTITPSDPTETTHRCL